MTYQKTHPVPALLIPDLASPPADSSTSGLWEYYRREKRLDRRLARQIDALAGTAADRDTLRQALNAGKRPSIPSGYRSATPFSGSPASMGSWLWSFGIWRDSRSLRSLLRCATPAPESRNCSPDRSANYRHKIMQLQKKSIRRYLPHENYKAI